MRRSVINGSARALMKKIPRAKPLPTAKTAAPALEVNFEQAHRALLELSDPAKAEFFKGFFKTGRGEYGEGDRFLGIPVPGIRRLGRQFRQLSLPGSIRLLESDYNEERLLALIILGDQYLRGDLALQENIYQAYLDHRQRVNNWNLVDASAPYIAGAHLLERDRGILYRLAKSASLWDRRIAVVATFAFIRANDFEDTLKLTRGLLNDSHDLMHKACGWMLREVGKRDQRALEAFLTQHHRAMPRTMLRYAIERFPETRRLAYLKGTVSVS